MTAGATSGGRVVAVTGGSRGIGAAVVAAFARNGDCVASLSRSGEAPAGCPNVLSVACDVADAASVDAAVGAVEERLGPVEVLVANAGITRDGLLATMPEQAWTTVLDTNLGGAYRLAKRVSRGMVRARRGRLIFISSIVGLSGAAGQANYAASKAGLVGLARALAHELAPRSITANVVAPGPVETEMLAEVGEQRLAAMLAGVPLRRLGQPEEVAAAVLFLASPEAAFITGAVLPVDGGAGMGH